MRNKLSVEKALNKLRETYAPKPTMTQLDDKIAELQDEARRLRTMNQRRAEHAHRRSSRWDLCPIGARLA